MNELTWLCGATAIPIILLFIFSGFKIDVIMTLSSVAKLPEIKIESQDMYFAHQKPLVRSGRKNYTTTKQFMDRKIRCATVEGLILLKLFALPSLYRQGSFERVGIYENDIATLMYTFNPKMKPLLKELSKHLNEDDIVKAQKIVAEIESRIQRFRTTNKQGSFRLRKF